MVVKCSDFGPIEGYISETMQDKLVLITNRKSHMSFRLVSKSVTLNDPERRNLWPSFCVKVVEDIPKLSATENVAPSI